MSEALRSYEDFSVESGLLLVRDEIAQAGNSQKYIRGIQDRFARQHPSNPAVQVVLRGVGVLRKGENVRGVDDSRAAALGTTFMQGGFLGLHVLEKADKTISFSVLPQYKWPIRRDFSSNSELARARELIKLGEEGYKKFTQPVRSDLDKMNQTLNPHDYFQRAAFRSGIGFVLHAARQVIADQVFESQIAVASEMGEHWTDLEEAFAFPVDR